MTSSRAPSAATRRKPKTDSIRKGNPFQQATKGIDSEFGLKAFPGQRFKINRSASYESPLGSGNVMLYVFTEKGEAFCKGTREELLPQIVKMPRRRSLSRKHLLEEAQRAQSEALATLLRYAAGDEEQFCMGSIDDALGMMAFVRERMPDTLTVIRATMHTWRMEQVKDAIAACEESEGA